MPQKRNIFIRAISFLWSVINNTRKLILNLIVFGLFVVIIAALSKDGQVTAPQDAALVINIQGSLVEQKRPSDPLDQLLKDSHEQSQDEETLVSDVLDAIESAHNDDSIKMLVIDSSAMQWGSLSKLQTIGKALTEFKQSEKPIYAIGGSFNQAQYYLASFADKILMNSKGMVSIDGFARYRLYHKALLEKLKVNAHVFRVGTFKSALEPFLRNDMSMAAKTANKSWLNDLWHAYVSDVSAQRELSHAEFDLSIKDYLVAVKEAKGNFAQAALDLGLVDEIDSNINILKTLVDLVGPSKNKLSYNKIGLNSYLAQQRTLPDQQQTANIAIIVAKGTILNGHQPAGLIGGASTSLLLRKARLNDDIRAVVLRIDSGGGSAYASEQIRTEVLALQQAGKPVIASMGSVAASGGYWIAANADKIIAQPTTITGSIGIFGMITTFERSLESIGVFTDGVGTKELSGVGITRDLPSGFKDLMQAHIEHGYAQFIGLVSSARSMTLEEVDAIAQGRVWSGSKALEFGLVDELGGLELAIESAAKIANLQEYSTMIIRKELTPMQQIYRDILKGSIDTLGIEPRPATSLSKIFGTIEQSLSTFRQFDDPQNAYLYCLECQY